jgi:hypothetical protein
MDQWELHTHGLMNADAKSTHKEVVVYPAEWNKQTEDKSIETPKNDNDHDIDLSASIPARRCVCFNSRATIEYRNESNTTGSEGQ